MAAGRAAGLPSFSRPDNPDANARAEAGWRTPETELLLPGAILTSLEYARLQVAYYLGACPHLNRCYPALVYHLPHQSEQHLKTTLS